jgi:hypothetical protein
MKTRLMALTGARAMVTTAMPSATSSVIHGPIGEARC